MQDDIDLFEPGELAPDYPELQNFAQSLLAEGALPTVASAELDNADPREWMPRETVQLDLGELLSTDASEIVLEGHSHLQLTADSSVTDAGFVENHVTPDGSDVSGYGYMTFASGVTVFYPDSSDLVLDAVI